MNLELFPTTGDGEVKVIGRRLEPAQKVNWTFDRLEIVKHGLGQASKKRLLYSVGRTHLAGVDLGQETHKFAMVVVVHLRFREQHQRMKPLIVIMFTYEHRQTARVGRGFLVFHVHTRLLSGRMMWT